MKTRKVRLSEVKKEAERLTSAGQKKEAAELWHQAAMLGDDIVDDSIPKSLKTKPIKLIG